MLQNIVFGKNTTFTQNLRAYTRESLIYHHMPQIISDKIRQAAGRYLRYLPFLLAFVIWIILVFREQYYLRKVEDLSLFLFDGRFVLDSFSTPGGLLGLAGSFLTQFLHIPWLGALIWVILLLISYNLTIKALRIPDTLSVLAMIPVALLVIYNMSLGYGVFIMRAQDHFFAPLLGYITVLIPLFAIRNIRSLWGRILFVSVWTAAGYPILGTFALVGTLSASLLSLAQREDSRSNRLIISVAGLALTVLVPIILYSLYTTYRLPDSWEMGLPDVSYDSWRRPTRMPLQLALLSVPVLAVFSRWLRDRKAGPAVQLSVCVAAIVTVWGSWYKDDNFHTELAMSYAVDRSDWQQVTDIYTKATAANARSDAKAYAARTKELAGVKDNSQANEITERYQKWFFEPTRNMVMYRDLALLKSDRALDEAFSMKDGSRLQNSRSQIPMALQAGKQFYLHYGLVNMCYRWCFEDAVENGWNYSTLKYITMHAVIMQDGNLADKFTGKLSKTLFYRKWAKAQQALGSDPVAMAKAEPYRSILPLRCFDDRMTNDMVKSETFLLSHFTGQQPPSSTPEYDRAALFFAMRTQDIPLFWDKLAYYVSSNNFKVMPRNVQEAIILYSTLENRDYSRLPLEEKVQKSYDSFNRFAQSHPVRSIKESSYPYWQKYGKTFFYFYYFIRDMQTY